MNCTLEHVGYLTDNIAKTAEAFRFLGYQCDDIVNDDTQRTRICFLRKPGETNIELVEPYPENKTMMKMLKKGVAPYHTCYTVDNIHEAHTQMAEAGFTPLFEPVEAPAFNNRKICYFWKGDTGLIELVDS